MSSGNHDSAVRLQYAGEVLAEAGIHLRTTIDQVTDPVLLADEAGQVGVYGIPFVLPDAVVAELEVERSHAAVLGVLADRIRTDAAARGLERVVVMAHAFVTGGSACESEREIRVGGVGDTPAEVFDGVSYVALGHLHGPQEVRLAGTPTVVEYSGSPLAFSFSERDHTKSVTVVDIDAAGVVATRRVPAPVPRPLIQVHGRLADLLDRAHGDLSGLADAWVKVVLTDPGRLANPMEQLRAHWPHTLVLEFAPERDDAQSGPHEADRGQRPGRDLRGVRECGLRGPAEPSSACGPRRGRARGPAGGGISLMRLHTLRMNAVGPFADEQVIDFDRLGAGGLFLFEGPTGVGKSTILDALTFALYGGLASDAGDPARLRSDFAGPDDRPEVTLEFSVRGGRHRITRSPEYARPKRAGHGRHQGEGQCSPRAPRGNWLGQPIARQGRGRDDRR